MSRTHRDGAGELATFAKQLSEDARLAIGLGLIRKAQLQPKYKLPRECSQIDHLLHVNLHTQILLCTNIH